LPTLPESVFLDLARKSKKEGGRRTPLLYTQSINDNFEW